VSSFAISGRASRKTVVSAQGLLARMCLFLPCRLRPGEVLYSFFFPLRKVSPVCVEPSLLTHFFASSPPVSTVTKSVWYIFFFQWFLKEFSAVNCGGGSPPPLFLAPSLFRWKSVQGPTLIEPLRVLPPPFVFSNIKTINPLSVASARRRAIYLFLLLFFCFFFLLFAF